MFSYLRSKMKVIFIIVAVAFLVTIFAFWGMDIDSSQLRGNAAFTVNGEDVPIRVYEDVVSRYLQNLGSNTSDDIRRQVRRQAADDLIGQKILEQTAKKLGFYATREELKGHLHAMFPNEQTYQQYLARADSRWWQIMEEDTEKRIEINRARSLMADGVWISEPEWRKILTDLYWEADVSHIVFSPFTEVSDSDVADYYRVNRHLILEPTKVRTRQILFKLAPDAPDSVVQKAREEAARILQLARAGKDFTALAKKYSGAPDAEDGGDMGFYKAGDMLKEVDDVVFGMEAGQVSDPVHTEFGIHIFKLEEKIPATIRPWSSDLADEIRPGAVTDTHWELAKARAQRVLDVLSKSPDQFEMFAKLHSHAESGKKGGHVGWIPRLIFPTDMDPTPLVGEVTTGAAVEREVSRLAFESPVGGIATQLARSTFGWHIIKVQDRRQITAHAPTDTDIAMVRQTYLKLLSEQTLSTWLEQERKKAKIEYKIDIES